MALVLSLSKQPVRQTTNCLFEFDFEAVSWLNVFGFLFLASIQLTPGKESSNIELFSKSLTSVTQLN